MKYFLILLFIFINSSNAFSDISNLEKIRDEIKLHETVINDLINDKKILENEIYEINKRIKLISNEKESIASELNKLEFEISEIQLNVNILEVKKKNLKKANKERYINLYKNWKAGDVIKLKSFDSNILSFDKIAIYTNLFQKRDKEILSEFIAIEDKLVLKKDELISLFNDQDKLKLKLLREKKKLESSKNESNKLLKTLKLRENKINSELISLRAKSLRFETALTELIQNNDEFKLKNESYLTTESKKVTQNKDRKLNGLEKKSYSFPLKSKVRLVNKFGKRRVLNLNDHIFSKGIMVKGSETQEVFSINRGQVVFVGQMPSYNLVIIINHGKRDYSLYANLNKVFLKQNEAVEKEQIIGEYSPKESDFYFEIRNNGTAVDPFNYIKNINDVLIN